jgi:hypothetical protein
MASTRVEDFLPSTSGLHFPNAFPHAPAVEIPLPDGQTLGIGDAANGLCGGMAFTARDYFEAHRPPPPDTTPPAEGSPLFEYLVGRLIASFNLPLGIARYLELMDPLRPTAETFESLHGLGLHSCGWIMVEQEWSKVQQELDSGHPAPLGLVKVVSAHARDLGRNHQVLAYGYDLNGADLTLWLYDPNYPDRDDVCLKVSLANPNGPTAVTYAPSNETVVCFFHNPYAPATPPA